MGSPSCRAGFSLLLLLVLAPAASAWIPNGALLCGAAGDQRTPVAIPDGVGGVVVVWEDRRGGASDVYAQRLASNGSPIWAADGIPVCAASGEQITPSVVADGAGGVIVAWEDLRGSSSDVYAQRIDALGVVRWTIDGIQVCDAAGLQTTVVAVTDGAGGAILTWADSRGATSDIYAQRIDGTGATRWAPNGVALGTGPGEQANPVAAADLSGGAVVAWSDVTVQAQRVDSLGALQWGLGVPVAAVSGFQFSPSIVADGAGGAIVSWTDMRSGLDQDIYAQRLSAGGAFQWGDSGKAVCAHAGYQFGPVSLPDGAGGTIVAWRDVRGASTDLYAQRVNAAGTPTWTADGLALCAEDGEQFSPAMTATGGGVVVAWHDQRSPQSDVYARFVTGAGVLQWEAGGVIVCGAAGDQQSAAIAADGKGGAIVIWDDGRGGSGSDLFAARVAGDGVLVPVQLALASATAEAGRVRIVWQGPGRAGLGAAVERRTATSGWRALADLTLDASGRFVFEDRAVASGARYGYRLAVREAGATTWTAETWIEVPLAVALAIEGTRPNPIERDALVSLSLPSARRARLELFDVRGRRVVDRDLGALGAGRHLVRLDEVRGLPGGAYLMRLSQDAASVTSKVLVRR